MVTNLGKWDRWYLGLEEPEPYGDTITYQLGADWLADCSLVEDWGCGKGWMRKFIPPERYRGIDGSVTPFADEIVDLAEYRSEVPGVFIRHVLEHNFQWAEILDNALASARERLVIVLFTPLSTAKSGFGGPSETVEIAYAEDPGVPDISFALSDLADPLTAAGFWWDITQIETATQYGVETMFRAERM